MNMKNTTVSPFPLLFLSTSYSLSSGPALLEEIAEAQTKQKKSGSVATRIISLGKVNV